MWSAGNLEEPQSNRGSVRTILLLLIIGASTRAAWADHVVSLGTANSIPGFCQQDEFSCGPAVAQMMLQGYPSGVEHVYTQDEIRQEIFENANDNVTWLTDPDGLKGAFMALGSGGGANWNIHANIQTEPLMYEVAFWMTTRRYPSAALVDPSGRSQYGSFNHWVVIEGFTTDVDPTANSAVKLKEVEIIDPLPSCVSESPGPTRQTIDGDAWYTTYWWAPGNFAGSKWHGKYVSVIEPPGRAGTAKAGRQAVKGNPIGEKKAQEYAEQWFKKSAIHKKAGYANLTGAVALTPMLVNSDSRGYYIVPFGYQAGGIARGGVIVNAYTGAFEEVGVFQRSMRYISRDRAIMSARSLLCACDAKDDAGIDTRLVLPGVPTLSRYTPLWKVTIGERIAYVTQQGEVTTELAAGPPGD